jgi:molybdenum cofactor cytidylyltransferase
MRIVILLAAGSSRRFGMSNKLFARWRGQTLLGRAVALARALPAQRILLVAGAQAVRVRRHARGLEAVTARDHREGLGASLRAASHRLRPIDREALVLLADMPWIDPMMVRRLIRAARPGDELLRPVSDGRPGHPVLLRGRALTALGGARGDEGVGRGRGYRVRLLPADRRARADVDRPADLRRAPPRLRR